MWGYKHNGPRPRSRGWAGPFCICACLVIVLFILLGIGLGVYFGVSGLGGCHPADCVYGTCLSQRGPHGQQCLCDPGYEGVYCDHAVNECQSDENRCEDTCINFDGGYRCSCAGDRSLNPDGFSCSEKKFCLEHQCENGECVEQDDGYMCECHDGYHGDKCQYDVDECQVNNGGCEGECTNTVGSYRCDCGPGRELNANGHSCDDINACVSSPCKFGKCKDERDGFTCECLAGWTGELCRDELDECAIDNGGCEEICYNVLGSYRCECPVGQSLSENRLSCIAIQDCAVDSCVNGQCVESAGSGFECRCLPGFAGDFCQSDFNECDFNNGGCEGDCDNYHGGYECVCPEGKVLNPNMHSCDDYHACQDEPCAWGECIEKYEGFECRCMSGYMGALCDINIDECATNNGGCEGTCNDELGDYSCDCPAGENLAINMHSCREIKYCLEDPCQYGTCVEGDLTYHCACQPGYSGVNCEYELCDTDAGWLYFKDTEHCYRHFDVLDGTSGNTQSVAESSCVQEGGHLASVNSFEEMQFIQTNILEKIAHWTIAPASNTRRPNTVFLWYGLVATSSGGPVTYSYTDGSHDTEGIYVVWDPVTGIPSASGCVGFLRQRNNDGNKMREYSASYPCTLQLTYLCEKPSGGPTAPSAPSALTTTTGVPSSTTPP